MVETRTKFEDQFSYDIWNSTYKHYSDITIDDTFKRVATAIASVEHTKKQQQYWADQFYEIMSNFAFVPGGRILTNAGTDANGTTLINCFVGPRDHHNVDSIDGIYKDLVQQAKTLKSEGGWGYNFSHYRPRGSFVQGILNETPGAVKFMELFDKSSEIITSGSGRKSVNPKVRKKIRKGAQMGVLDCWHPDIVEFITAKQQPGRLTKFNMSVNFTNEFMDKILNITKLNSQKAPKDKIAEADKWDLIFPDTNFSQYNQEWDGNINKWAAKGYPIIVHATISAMWLWELTVKSTYNRAEPGVLFLDRANTLNPFWYRPDIEYIHTTNPCGEQTLSFGNICCLGSLNLTQFINIDRTGFDFEKIKQYVAAAIRFLDNVDDYSNAPLPQYKQSMKNKRRVGLGVMGWGSALYMLKMRFAGDEANKLRAELMKVISHAAYVTSVDLAEEKGAFKYCIPEKHASGLFVKSLNLPQTTIDKMKKVGIRNSSLLSIQPTGNSSIFSNIVSGGIEPVFMPEYIRTVIVDHPPDDIIDMCPKWFEGAWHETDLFKFDKEGDENILKGITANGDIYKIDKNRGLTKEVLCEDYGVRYLKRLGEWDPKADWAVTTTNLTVNDHLTDLCGFAEWICSAISKTINIPNNYSFDKFQNVYLDAYKTGIIKGITTYRAGTMAAVLSVQEEKNAEKYDEEIIKDDVQLPTSAPAYVKTLRAEGKKYYLTVTYFDNIQQKPFALFVKSNTREPGPTTAVAVDSLLTFAKKKKIPKRHIEKVREKISNDNNTDKIARSISLLLRHGILIKNIVSTLESVDGVYAGSFLFQITKFLSTYIKDGEVVEDVKCTECGGELIFESGCTVCKQCGSSKCG